MDRIDARDPLYMGAPEYQRYTRLRARQFRWTPATATRPEGMAAAGGSSRLRFDAGGLDGDQLQAVAIRFNMVPRSMD